MKLLTRRAFIGVLGFFASLKGLLGLTRGESCHLETVHYTASLTDNNWTAIDTEKWHMVYEFSPSKIERISLSQRQARAFKSSHPSGVQVKWLAEVKDIPREVQYDLPRRFKELDERIQSWRDRCPLT